MRILFLVLGLMAPILSCDATDDGPDAAADAGDSETASADPETPTDTGEPADTASETASDPGGVCIGDPVPCAEFTFATCALQTGCTLETGCGGTAASCAAVGLAGCATQVGCIATGFCGGASTPCGSLFAAVECAHQLGCTWNSGTSRCGGTALGCGGMGSEVCLGQDGCAWTTTGCAGTAAECATLDGALCSSQVGCENVDECFGTPKPCGQITVGFECLQHFGCNWVGDTGA